MKDLSYHSYNASTAYVRKRIEAMFWQKEYPLAKVSTKNVKVIVKALMEEYHKEYVMKDIDLELCNDSGLSLAVKLDALDDWNTPEMNHSTEDWLYRSLKNLIEVLGKPTEVTQSGDKYYAVWMRNIVTWF